MCKIIEFNGNKGNMNTKRIEQIRREAEKCEQRHTGGLSTEALVKEYVQNGKNIQKLVCYMIEQYGYMFTNRENNIIEEVKRDVRYCDIYPEIKNKRFRAPLAVKIRGRWHMVEIFTTYASVKAFRNKMDTIGNYNVSGFSIYLTKFETKEMTDLLWNKEIECFWPAIVEKAHDIFFYEGNNRTYTFDQDITVIVKGESGLMPMPCQYKMLELSFPDYVILEGVDIRTNNKHLLMLCIGNELEKYANCFEEKYRDADVPLFYARWRNGADWKTALNSGFMACTLYRSIEGLREEYR